MKQTHIFLAVKTALATPGAFVTERGVEVERRNGYKELLVSHRGLKTSMEAVVVEQPLVEPEVPAEEKKEEAPVDEVVVIAPLPEAPVEPTKVEAPVEEVKPVEVVEVPKAKPGPKPKAVAAK